MTQAIPQKDIEQYFFVQLNRWKNVADRIETMIFNRAKKHAQLAGIPTSYDLWPVLLHNWIKVPLARGDEALLCQRGFSKDQIENGKVAISILANLHYPSSLVRGWARKYVPVPMQQENYKYWQKRITKGKNGR